MTGRVLVLDTDFPGLEVERAAAQEAELELVEPPPGSSWTGLPAPDLARFDAVLVQWSDVDAAAMDALPRLRAIGRIGLGLDQIDLAAAKERGIAVVNSGDYATEEVSLHAIALMLAVVRRIPRSERAVRAGGWFEPDEFAGVPRLSGLTLGLLGLGRIGGRVAEIATALGMRVIAHDPFAGSGPVPLVPDLDSLLRDTDVLSLHAPLTEATRHVIGSEQLHALRSGAVLINTSRGGLVDHDALVAALADGHLSGAGLDVVEPEPLPAGHPLTHDERVVLTPHSAYYSDVSAREARRRPIEAIAAALSGPPSGA